MKKEETKMISDLLKLMQDIKQENSKFRDEVNNTVGDIKSKVEKTYTPINFEKEILKSSQIAVSESIDKVLTGYDSPLVKLTKSVIDQHSEELRELISDSFSKVIRTEDFKQSIISAFSHKVARTIISNNDGLFDKVSNELKQDSKFKSKMTLAVANVVEECLKKD